MRKTWVLFLLLLMSALSSLAQQANPYLLIGTYTGSGSVGIYVYRFNTHTGEFNYVSDISSSNPSFLAIAPSGNFVYAVNEDEPGSITAYSFDKKTGKLQKINEVSSEGDHPCYITTDRKGKWVVVGNYSSGTIAVYPVQKNGGLGKAVQVIRHTGSSVNTDRQEAPHVHATVFSPDNKFLLVPDLGIDQVVIYVFNEKKGSLGRQKQSSVSSEPGSGPRHLTFSADGKKVYLLEELTGTIAAFRFEKGNLQLFQNLSAQPLDYLGPAGSADIHLSPDGKFLYASNRAESNTIGIFQVDKASGYLSLADHVSTEGKTPRNFNFAPGGKFLLAANQNSNQITVFSVDTQTGFLTDTGKRINLPRPVYIGWIQ